MGRWWQHHLQCLVSQAKFNLIIILCYHNDTYDFCWWTWSFHNHCFVIWNNVDCLSFQIRSKIFQRSYNCKKVKLWHAVLYLVLRKNSASTNDQSQYFAFIFMSEAAKRINFVSASRMNSPSKSTKCSIGYTDNFCLSICSGERCQYFCRIKFL